MILSNSVTAERSADNSWAVTPVLGIPSGVIIDLQFSFGETVPNVYLTSMRVAAGSVQLLFRDGSDRLLASIDTQTTGIPVALECRLPGLYANILLGYIPEVDGEYVSADNRIQINPSLVSRYGKVRQGQDTSGYINIVHKGELIFSQPLRGSNVYLLEGYGISLTDDSMGNVLVGKRDNVITYADSTPKLITERNIYSINYVKSTTGELDIIIQCDKYPEGITVTAVGRDTFVVSTSAEVTALLAPVDQIDEAIQRKPDRSTYLPLDDCYYDGNGGLGVRATMKNLDVIHALTADGTALEPTHDSVKVNELNYAFDVLKG